MNYFWIAWAYIKNPAETIVDFKANKYPIREKSLMG